MKAKRLAEMVKTLRKKKLDELQKNEVKAKKQSIINLNPENHSTIVSN